MISKDIIKKCWDLEGTITTKLKKIEKDKMQRIGIITILRHSKDYEKALIQYGIYLDSNYNLNRDKLIGKAIEIQENY